MRHILIFVFSVLIPGFLFTSCEKTPIGLYQPTNVKPLANAGGNQVIILPGNSIILKGSGTDPDGKIVRYIWTNLEGPSLATIKDPNMAETEIKDLVHGVYLFELEVTDNSGAFSRDKALVFVLDSLTDPLNTDCNGCWDY